MKMSIIDCTIPINFEIPPGGWTPNPTSDLPMYYKEWRIRKWTGFKGNKAIYNLEDKNLCPICNQPKNKGDEVWISQEQDVDSIPHWACYPQYPRGLVGQWLAYKGPADGTAKLIYSSTLGSSGPYRSGGVFDIGIKTGQKELSYESLQGDLLQAREDALVELKRAIDRAEAGEFDDFWKKGG